ncbi:uncharacterized protein DS421_5g163050 [Arachis hypogaea]|nr:uncharacterized protein DS421_5g163050 [Arachis hypogaea]
MRERERERERESPLLPFTVVGKCRRGAHTREKETWREELLPPSVELSSRVTIVVRATCRRCHYPVAIVPPLPSLSHFSVTAGVTLSLLVSDKIPAVKSIVLAVETAGNLPPLLLALFRIHHCGCGHRKHCRGAAVP